VGQIKFWFASVRYNAILHETQMEFQISKEDRHIYIKKEVQIYRQADK
jgi:hypothetical protein